jgi:sulfur-oxidizing protein SoxX
VASYAGIKRRAASLALVLAASSVSSAQIVPYRITQDGITIALTTQTGNANRGYEIASNRQIGMCVLCHQIPNSSDKFQGDIGTSLAGAGARWSVPQLRLRVVDSRRVNADSVMPAYHKVEGLSRVGAAWRDKPILDAQQVEDVVAWLATLK